MIQRKQTLWLLLVAIAAFLTLKFSFYTGNVLDKTGVKVFTKLDARYNILILIITIAIAVASLITIFLYKDRKKQMLLCGANLLLSTVTIVLYYFKTKLFVDGAYSISSILTFVVPILLILAINGIYKDEKLIKSVDRLR